MNKIYKNIVEDLTDLGYEFRMNTLDDSLEVKGKENWSQLTDVLKCVIRTSLRGMEYGSRKKPSLGAVEDAWVTLALKNSYNPIKDYFTNLEGQYQPDNVDKATPYITNLFTTFFECPDNTFNEWLFKWMTGAIAKLFQQERNPMLVLIGNQRIGKSFFARWLCPLNKDIYFLEKGINPDNKDDKFRLIDSFIWELPELGATTRRQDVESLKAFITMRNISERKQYGRLPIYKPAACSFIGSVNYDGAGFLNDPTGSSRFLSCEITNIDFNYTTQNLKQLWAEAYWFYKNVPKCWELTPKQKEKQAKINKKFEIVSALEDTLLHYFEITHSPNDFMSTQSIKQYLLSNYNIGNENGFFRELSRTLYKLGVTKTRQRQDKKQIRGWTGIKPQFVHD